MHFISWNSVISFLVGTAVGMFVMYAIVTPTEHAPIRGGTSNQSRGATAEIARSTSDQTNSTAAELALNDAVTETPITVEAATKPNTPQVYVELMGPTYEDVSFADLHLTFSQQPRDEAWAYGVESEITQYIANNNVAESAEIDYVECRKSICEIGGYSHGDTDYDAREILDGISDAAWWYPSRSTHRMRGGSGELRYFVVIVTGLNFERRLREPRAVE